MSDDFIDKVGIFATLISGFMVSTIFMYMIYCAGVTAGKKYFEDITLDNITTEQLIHEIKKRVGE